MRRLYRVKQASMGNRQSFRRPRYGALREIAGTMVPADADLGVPGADDPAIFADIVRSLGRDLPRVRKALAEIAAMAADGFAASAATNAEALINDYYMQPAAPRSWRSDALILSAYYRDDRVLLCAGHRGPRPLPQGLHVWNRATGRCSTPCATARRCGATTARSWRNERQRARRCPDHRLRRLGRGGRLEPRRNQDAHPLPGAGRLDEADRLPQQRPRLGSAALHRFRHQPEPPRRATPTIRSTTTTRRSRSPTSTASAAARSSTRRTGRACTRRTSA